MTHTDTPPIPDQTVFAPESRSERPSLPILSAEDRERIRAERAAKVADWSKLPLRQEWADEAWMRGFLSRAGLRIASDMEPATPERLRTMLRRAGLTYQQWTAAVGCTLAEYLVLNPGLPLWAATALVLEADNPGPRNG